MGSFKAQSSIERTTTELFYETLKKISGETEIQPSTKAQDTQQGIDFYAYDLSWSMRARTSSAWPKDANEFTLRETEINRMLADDEPSPDRFIYGILSKDKKSFKKLIILDMCLLDQVIESLPYKWKTNYGRGGHDSKFAILKLSDIEELGAILYDSTKG